MAMLWMKHMWPLPKPRNNPLTVLHRSLTTHQVMKKINQQVMRNPVRQRLQPWPWRRKKNPSASSPWPLCTDHRFWVNAKNSMSGSIEKICLTSLTNLLYTVLMVKQLIVPMPIQTKGNNKPMRS